MDKLKDLKVLNGDLGRKSFFKYVKEPTKRRIIWVVGEKGDEGK